MSTRRARIKAVASLPVRRKNNDTSEKSKPSPKQGFEVGPSITQSKHDLDFTKNEKKEIGSPVAPQTPKRGRRSSIQTPQSKEPAPQTPKSLQKTPISPKVQQDARATPKNQAKQLEKSPKPLKLTPSTPKLPERLSGTQVTHKDTPSTPRSRKTSTPQKIAPNVTRSTAIRPVALITNLNNVESNQGNNSIPITISVNNCNRSVIDPKGVLNQTKTTESTPTSQNKDATESLDGISKISYSNPPSIPESVTEDSVFDGIVPLQSARSVPKPLDLLKNEITSENAEVLFDPIVPLPSPSKVRPKLRPAPRLAFRRNSIQGSASESEDESRRALLNSGASTPGPPRQRHDSHASHFSAHAIPNREAPRVRNDSACSVVSQLTVHAQPQLTPAAAAAAAKEKHVAKSRRTEMSRRMSALRRKQRRENVPRDTLTMYDLIFYNPTTNPIVREEDETETTVTKDVVTEVAQDKEGNANSEAPQSTEREEAADDPPERDDLAPVPQLKLGPNGEIILDEKSLVINQTEGPRKLTDGVVREYEWASGGRGKYTRARRTADWTDAETVRFYRALAAVGTDFTMMRRLFPDRTRRDLKVKFKKEERINGAQVDKALRSQIEWDAINLESEFKRERRLAAERAESERQAFIQQKKAEKARIKAARDDGYRLSKASKALESGIEKLRAPAEIGSADDLIQKCMEDKKQQKLRKSKALTTVNVINKDFAIPLQNTPKPFTPSPKITPNTLNPTVRLTPITAHLKITPKSNRSLPNLNPIVPNVPQNIESGSLVVLTVNDPNEPTKKMLQTYISHGQGKLTPVALPSTLLNSVVTYMKKGTPKSTSNPSSAVSTPIRPSSTASQESASRSSVIQLNPSPAKRPRFDSASYTITQL